MGYSWLKLWIEVLDDWKIAPLPDRLWRRFVEVCLIAKRADEEGYLPSLERVAFILRLKEEELEQDLKELERLTKTRNRPGVVRLTEEGRWFVTNLTKRQAPLTPAERKRRQRAREARKALEGHEPSKEPVTKSDYRQQTTDNRLQTNRRQTADNRQQNKDPVAADEVAIIESFLEDLGVVGKKASQLIDQYHEQGELHILVPRLERWLMEASRKPGLTNPTGYAITQVEAGREPLEELSEDDYWREMAERFRSQS